MSVVKRYLKLAEESEWDRRDVWYASAFHALSGAIAHFSEGNEKLGKRQWNNWAKVVLTRVQEFDRDIKEHDSIMIKQTPQIQCLIYGKIS